MNEIKGIIFDLDGTLIKLPVNWKSVIKGLSRLLKRQVNSLINLYPTIWNTPNYEITSKYIEAHELKAINKLSILDNSPHILIKLHGRYKLGLVTFQSRKTTSKILEKLNITHLFKAISTRNEAPTREEQIGQVISNLNLKADNTLIVGDRLNDVFSALKLGCKAILIDRYNRKMEKTLTRGFNVIYNLNEIFKLLNS